MSLLMFYACEIMPNEIVIRWQFVIGNSRRWGMTVASKPEEAMRILRNLKADFDPDLELVILELGPLLH